MFIHRANDLWGFSMPKSYSNNQIAPNVCVGIGACIQLRIGERELIKKIDNNIRTIVCAWRCVCGMCGV